MVPLRVLIPVSASLLGTVSLHAAFPPLALKPVCLEQIYSPTNITTAGDGSRRIFICDQPGTIHILQGGMLRPTPFLDLTSNGNNKAIAQTSGYSERGLLGMAFHPGYTNPASPGHRKFYVYYSAVSPNTPGPATDPVNHRSVIAEYQVTVGDANLADPNSERILFTLDQPQSNHNGGQLEFGPDGFLYIGLGDGGSSQDNNAGHTGGSSARPATALGNGQDRRTLLGKILRIDPLGSNGPGGQYGIPVDNPFIGQSQDFADNSLDGPIRGEIYAWGLRNPWRFSFDKRPGGTGRLFCGDVGQGSVEEVNLITSGGNFGWRAKEGTFVPSFSSGMGANAPVTSIDPVAQYEHPGLATSLGLPAYGLSITGGYVYRGSAIAGLAGKYVFADYGATSGTASGRIMGLEETAPGSGSFVLSSLGIVGGNPTPYRINCLGEDENGELYLGTKVTPGVLELGANGKRNGGIYKIVAVTSTNVTTATTTLSASKDNTLFAESNDLSNGVGPYLFSGVTAASNAFATRRAVIAFDLSGLPAGAPVTAAQLTLVENKTIVGSKPVALCRVTTDWGEGTSNSGDPGGTGAGAATNDATWSAAKYHVSNWTTPGGDLIATPSATADVIGSGFYNWTSATMVDDVEGWRSAPATNFGWMLVGMEGGQLVGANGTEISAKRFASRHHATVANRPKLAVTYATALLGSRRDNWLTTHFPTQPVGFYLADEDDSDGDGVSNQLEYAWNFSPLTSQSLTDGLNAVASPGTGGATAYTITFRRDPTATDLTYRLQSSTDFASWTTITTSVAGAAPTGSAFLSDTDLSGQSPMKLVTARQTVPAGDRRLFVRLQVDRAP
jgi:glucose/arabinose dehydrogenase